MQLWNAASLTLDKKFSAHIGAVRDMAISPLCAQYDCRIATVGQDNWVRLWHSSGCWLLEAERRQKPSEASGITSITGCCFSPDGMWFITVAAVLSVWRVCKKETGSLWLCLHQRLEAVGSIDGICAAAYSGKEALVIGTRDGVLGAWARQQGLPPDFPYEEEEEIAHMPSLPDKWSIEERKVSLPRPMRRVMALAVGPLAHEGRSIVQTGPEGWLTTWQLKSTTTTLSQPQLAQIKRKAVVFQVILHLARALTWERRMPICLASNCATLLPHYSQSFRATR
jgi:hypothetical protein